MRVSGLLGETKSRAICVLAHVLPVPPRPQQDLRETISVPRGRPLAQASPTTTTASMHQRWRKDGRREAPVGCKGRQWHLASNLCGQMADAFLGPRMCQLCLRAWNLWHSLQWKPQDQGVEFLTSPSECGERVKGNYWIKSREVWILLGNKKRNDTVDARYNKDEP